jgi:hypothetical protein
MRDAGQAHQTRVTFFLGQKSYTTKDVLLLEVRTTRSTVRLAKPDKFAANREAWQGGDDRRKAQARNDLTSRAC